MNEQEERLSVRKTAMRRGLGEMGRALLVLSLLCMGAGVHAQMNTAGQFAVSASGAATYSIPIQVPPGVAGMAPRLSLEYSSQGGNGLLGVGWSLGGMSMITRCPLTMAQDGVRGAVAYDQNDRFCLDGQRLVLVSGVYGAAGSEYRTEVDAQTKVVAYGSQVGSPKGQGASTAPKYFRVWTKAGNVIDYGNTEDSRIEAEGTTVPVLWLQNRIQDRKSNYIDWLYYEDNSTGEWYPAQINYSGNLSGNSSQVGSVVFGYESRPDVVTVYHAGSVVKVARRISKVTTVARNGGSVFKDYFLGYQSGPNSGRSRLMGVLECAVDGACLPMINFDWQKESWGVGFSSPVFYYPNSWNFGVGDDYRPIISGDYNGDGRSDFLRIGSKYAFVFLSNGDGSFYVPAFLYPDGRDFGADLNYWQVVGGDFNGDGKSDFARVGPTSTHLFFSKGDGTFSVKVYEFPYGWNFGWTEDYWKTIAADFNGDGIDDFARIGPTYVHVFIGNGDGGFHAAVFKYPSGWDFGTNVNRWQLAVGDFNGDGRADFSRVGPTSVHLFLGKGDGAFYAQVFNYPSGWNFGEEPGYWNLVTGDINGDGKTDFARVGPTYVHSFISKGDGTFDVPVYYYPSGWNFGADKSYRQIATGDFNGDGRIDFVRIGASYANVFLSKGDGQFSSPVFAYPNGWNFGSDPRYWLMTGGDFDGDGKADFARVGPTYAHVFMASGLMGDMLVVGRHTGMAPVFEVTYAPLTNKGLYAKGAGAAEAYPRLDIQVPIYVVNRAQSGDGLGGFRVQSYRYGGLKAELGTGRGLLGFAWQQVTDEATGISSLTVMSQSFPFVGLVVQSQKSRGGQLLESLTQQWSHVSYSGGSRDGVASVGPGKVYRVFATQGVRQGWDLGGLYLTGSRTTYSDVDDFNNVGRTLVQTVDAGGNSTGYETLTSSSYFNNPGSWILGRLVRSQVTHSKP